MKVFLDHRHWPGPPRVLGEYLAFSFCRQVESASGALENQTENSRGRGPPPTEFGAASDGETR